MIWRIVVKFSSSSSFSFSSNEIKLADVPELGCFSTDKPYPRGEICIRGPNVFKEYINNPEETKRVHLDETWIRTGDLGCFLPNRALRVIGRKCNSIKLSEDQIIHLDRLEFVYSVSPFVSDIEIRSAEGSKVCLFPEHSFFFF